ncbi:hypothetical protein OKA04_14125 [Luteolibacter flavescens]|uniref:Transmembrane protein n=1 Tax=Luteolibacter flavescens TaxID=1859460 RepID=A0ABT3FQM8_9BACT|nr:hypothetical protein [Luteolibacter flavescens]MCW1885872.1 hypothetical protein [Luteolibacter flavescens]
MGKSAPAFQWRAGGISGWLAGMQTYGPPPHPQAIQDAEHLKLLVIFHYVVGGMTALFGSFPIIHVVMGFMMVDGRAFGPPGSGPPPEFGWFFIVVGCCFILLAWTLAILMIYSGRCLSARRKRTFCFVIGCISCAGFPLGTALGIFTIIVLQRPSVRALFDRPETGGYLNS